jgi:hypothetical protein
MPVILINRSYTNLYALTELSKVQSFSRLTVIEKNLTKMRIKGLEPSLLAKPEPKSGASTNSAISAGNTPNDSTDISQHQII